jgi:hypothetical protein
MFDILGKGIQVVSIDENQHCLDIAAETLKKAGIIPQVMKRLRIDLTASGYEYALGEINTPFTAQCSLVEADICNDPILEHALETGEKFDAVTIWLTGSHMMRQYHARVREAGIRNDGDHRLYTENKVYEVADRILKVGGVLQVVDRRQAPNTELLREDVLRSHREQASLTSLEVIAMEQSPYSLPEGDRVPMQFTPGSAGIIPDAIELALVSILSVKR